jgi:hypothetical protein
MRPVPPPAGPAEAQNLVQGYLDPGVDGIGARCAWKFEGGKGLGIGFVDMERGWNLNHEALPPGIPIISGDNYDEQAHGTSVLGVVLMGNNPVGGAGIAPDSTGRVVSQWQPGGINNFDAIHSVFDSMKFGDVLLLEVQEKDPDRPDAFWADNSWPAEIAPGTYDILQWANALGIVVVEAAANGGNDLNGYTTGVGDRIFDSGVRDSGAIMVGAASSDYPHVPLGNTGTRIDCYAWGQNIQTASSNGDGTDNSAYTPPPVWGFGGTSGASAIVAGAALVVQGLAQACGRDRFSPAELRQILKTNGTKSAGGLSNVIGVMPNLCNIITDNRLDLQPLAGVLAAAGAVDIGGGGDPG